MIDSGKAMERNAAIERLGRAMGEAARRQPSFIGSDLAVWETANPGKSAAAELRCGDDQLWRLAVTPRPPVAGMASAAMGLAAAIGVNPTALINILRFAESARAFAGAGDDTEMLMAALDADEKPGELE
ncbi:MAG: hypothetical protein AAGC63_16315 [Propionicimonas sp.]